MIALYSGSVIHNVIGDGLNDFNHNTDGHIFNVVSLGIFMFSPIAFNFQKDQWNWSALSYISVHAVFFDLTYNLTRKLPSNFSCSTSITDKFYNSVGVNSMYPRATIFVVGFAIPLI